MGQPGQRDVNCTHSLFVDDLKVYWESHKALKDVDEIILQASNGTAPCYGVAKCAEIVFERRNMVKGEGLQVLNEKVKTMNPNENEWYNRVKEEINRRMNII